MTVVTKDVAERRVLAASENWERAYAGWSTGSTEQRDQHRITPQSEMRAAEKRLADAVRQWRRILELERAG